MVGNIYGHADATTCSDAKKANERMLRIVTTRAASFSETPYVLLGDLTCNPANSPGIQVAIACGVVFDCMADRGYSGPTYSNVKGGITQSASGHGTSRIDAILENRAAVNSINRVWADWEASSGFDHTVPGVELNVDTYVGYFS